MKRWLVGLIVLVVALAGLGVAGLAGVGYWLSPQSPLAKADAIVAISGGETEARTIEAVKLYRDGWAKHLIFSGAAIDPTGPSNARSMASAAKAAGVPASAIELDEAATNTTENARYVATITARHDYHSIILVTSPYHQRRAYISFRRILPGATIINHSSPDQAWRRSHWWASTYSQDLTIAELQKTMYVMWFDR